ncbi:hypothetical protein COU19_03360 [Candidatus Kaiserbacteria bacterium CG10_big_fil_rev_8_21_14_0_10_56_12]|uniref:Uncharacterized protein n=1 Tax=Candidatus Kaiserbacteria bacterium CG10_big_fil_rev_8_21_14_0_10_56_12 TaxID=1974611 RepID=A0A2H0UB75_9BACT|nr:MAG: hypothetical protein COU19_03360 [Candidatus Kaiserbacteria bacterium CG10_big_fil_rev_8_21_14_0_10_56_12]
MRNRQGLVLLVLLVIAVMLIGGYVYTQTMAGTTGWKTYTNTEYGFSFKYPPNWFAEADSVGNSVSFSESERTPISKMATQRLAAFYVGRMRSLRGPQFVTAEKYFDTYYGVTSFLPGTQVTAQWMTIQGIPVFYHYVVR